MPFGEDPALAVAGANQADEAVTNRDGRSLSKGSRLQHRHVPRERICLSCKDSTKPGNRARGREVFWRYSPKFHRHTAWPLRGLHEALDKSASNLPNRGLSGCVDK